MSIVPLDLQVLYAQQNNVSRMEHARGMERALVTQAEDTLVRQDSYMRDSTVVKVQETEQSRKVREKKEREEEEAEDRASAYVLYRKKRNRGGKNMVGTSSYAQIAAGKGKRINIFK